jgi:acyl carrier protein
MTDATITDIAPRVTAIVCGLLAKRGCSTSITATQDLRSAGLNSTDLVSLMLAVESEFDIFVPDDQMKPENFATIRAINALVASSTDG